jgi:hypothetical protein
MTGLQGRASQGRHRDPFHTLFLVLVLSASTGARSCLCLVVKRRLPFILRDRIRSHRSHGPFDMWDAPSCGEQVPALCVAGLLGGENYCEHL